MAKVFYSGLIDEIKGKLRGSIFQSNNSGFIVRGKPIGKKHTSLNQNYQNAKFTGLLEVWNNLSLEDKTLWNDFADTNEHTTIYNQSRTMTGLNWFFNINNNRVTAAETPIEQPPTYEIPTDAPLYTLSVSNEALVLDIETPEANDDRAILIFATPPNTRSSTLNVSQLRFIKYYAPTTFDTLDISTEYIDVFPVDYLNMSIEDKLNIQVLIVPIHTTSFINGVGRQLIGEFVYIEPFNPSHIANMLFWFDSSQEITKDGSDKVEQWNDLSDNGYNLKQSNSDYRPILVDDVLNNLPAVRYDGTLKFLITDYIPSYSNTPLFFAVVCTNSSTSGGGQTIFSSKDSAKYQLHLWPNDSNENIKITNFSQNLFGTYTRPLGNAIIFCLFNTTGSKIWLNNNLLNTGTINEVTGSEKFTLGRENNAGSYEFTGDIFNVIAYKQVPTDDERTDLYNYLKTLYNL